jgi:hypothetical protein
MALLTKGTVRLARGFTSRTNTSPSFTANCTFMSPRTSSASARIFVCRSISSTTRRGSVVGGSEQAESPECTPACSMCSMIPPMSTRSPSQMASTSTSMASSRKRRRAPASGPETLDRLGHVAAQARLVVDDLHRAAAEDVGRAHDHRIADLGGSSTASSSLRAVPLGGWRRPSRSISAWKRSRSSARSIESGEVPMMGTPAASRRRRASAASGRRTGRSRRRAVLLVDDLQHVLGVSGSKYSRSEVS